MASQPTRRPDDDPYYRIYEMRERERNSRVCKALRASKKKKPRRRSRSPVDGMKGSRKAQPLPAVELLSMEEQQQLRKQLFSPSRPTPPVGNIVISRSPPSPAASTVIEWTSDGAVFKSKSSNQESVVVAATASTERAVGVKTVTDDDADAPDPDADVDADGDGDGAAADESHAPTVRLRWEVALAHSTERAAQTLGRVLRSYHRREQMLGGASKRALGGIPYLAAATPTRRRVAEPPPSPGAGDGPVMPRAPRSPRRPSGSITSPLSMSPLASARRASAQSKTGPASVHPPVAFAAVAPPAETTGYASRRGSQLSAQEFVNALEADDDDDNDDDDSKSMSPISSTNSLPPTKEDGGPPADGAAEENRRASLVLEAKTEEEEVPGVPSNDLATWVAEVPTAPDSAPTAGEDRSPVPPLALGALDQAGTSASCKRSPPSMHPVLRHDSHKSQKSVQSAQSDVSSSSDGSRARPPIDRGGSAFGLAFLRSNENLQALVEEEEGDDDDSTASEHATTPAESRKSVSPAPTTLPAAAPQDRGEHGPEPDVSGKAPTVDTDDVVDDEDGVPINTNLLAKLNKKFSLRR